MKILSNKEIYVLLKILNNKSDSLEIDKTFTKDELEHIQQELGSLNGKPVIEIENTQKPVFGVMVHSGYAITIHDISAVKDYAVNYIEAYIKGDLADIASDAEFTKLLKDFHNSTQKQNSLTNYRTKDLKYMPVILFAYINNLVKLKSMSHEKYDYTADYPNDDTLSENLYLKVQANGATHELKIDLGIDVSKLSDVMLTVGYGNQQEEADAHILMELLKRLNSERASLPPESYDENALRGKLQKDFGLTELAVNILCACKYLMDNDVTSVGNPRISEYLTKNNFPVSVDVIKQCTRYIKEKCTLPETRGVASLVQALELKGYTIPPLKPTVKV